MVTSTADELAVDLPFWEVIIAAGRDDWWLRFFLHDDRHRIVSCASLVHLFGGPDHPRSCGVI